LILLKIVFFNFLAFSGSLLFGVETKKSSRPPFFSTVLIVLAATFN